MQQFNGNDFDDTLLSALRAYLPDPGMGRFLRRHPVFMVTWVCTGAVAFYLYLVTALTGLGGV